MQRIDCRHMRQVGLYEDIVVFVFEEQARVEKAVRGSKGTYNRFGREEVDGIDVKRIRRDFPKGGSIHSVKDWWFKGMDR